MNSGEQQRRSFLKTTAGLTALAVMPGGVHAGASGKLKVGLVGCGGRGTGAASQALRADKETELVAMGDMFKDRAEGSVAQLKRDAEIVVSAHLNAEHVEVRVGGLNDGGLLAVQEGNFDHRQV